MNPYDQYQAAKLVPAEQRMRECPEHHWHCCHCGIHEVLTSFPPLIAAVCCHCGARSSVHQGLTTCGGFAGYAPSTGAQSPYRVRPGEAVP